MSPRQAISLLLLGAGGLAATPVLAAPPSDDAGAVSIPVSQFVLNDGGTLDYLALTPQTWGAPAAPARFRVYVIPGSGCRGLGPVATAYFRGLQNGEVIVPHKRYASAKLWGEAGNSSCSDAFIQYDSLPRWAEDAKAFLHWHLREHPPRADQPVALVGVSEGAELLPALAVDQPAVSLLAVLGGTGLDPHEALSLQAARQNAPKFVAELTQRAAEGSRPDDELWAGRSMGYWRGLLAWRYSDALLRLPQPLWIGFGGRDSSVPEAGLLRFRQRAQTQSRPLCVALFPGSDHNLQRAGDDADLQQFWAWIASALTRRAATADCAPLSLP